MEALVNIIDSAICDGYRVEDKPIIFELFQKIIKELNLNKKTDNYYKERYGID